jgi:hypothetical protein
MLTAAPWVRSANVRVSASRSRLTQCDSLRRNQRGCVQPLGELRAARTGEAATAPEQRDERRHHGRTAPRHLDLDALQDPRPPARRQDHGAIERELRDGASARQNRVRAAAGPEREQTPQRRRTEQATGSPADATPRSAQRRKAGVGQALGDLAPACQAGARRLHRLERRFDDGAAAPYAQRVAAGRRDTVASRRCRSRRRGGSSPPRGESSTVARLPTVPASVRRRPRPASRAATPPRSTARGAPRARSMQCGVTPPAAEAER